MTLLKWPKKKRILKMDVAKGIPECDLCGERIKIRVLLPCNHNNICLNCFIRFNRNYKGNHCYFCQNPIEKGGEPIATTNLTLDYESAKKKNPSFNERFNIYTLEKEQINEALEKIYEFTCPDCGIVLPTIDAFSSHMRTHKKNVCNICYASGRFPPESVPIFTHVKYLEHLKHHPRCICCNKTCFDAKTLADHMREEHQRCELCAKLNKIEWFKNTDELIKHNEQKHFVCHHPSCSSENLIAFLTRGELLMHLQKVHHEKERQIDLTTDFDNGIEADDGDDPRERMIALNKKLMAKINEVFKNNPEGMKTLRNYAKSLIEGRITCNEFYNQFSRICGDKKDFLFCDMVASMPDPRKRAELFRIHNGISSLSQPRTKVPRSSSNPTFNRTTKEPTSARRAVTPMPGPESVAAQPRPQPHTQAPQPEKKKKEKKKKIILSAF